MVAETPCFPARLLLLCLVALALPGCYYLHLARGQLALGQQRQDLDAVQADPATPDALRTALARAAAARDFAHRELALPDNGSYRSFIALGRPYVSWAVYAAPEFSLKPQRWCHLLVGCVPYRGYFSEALAQQSAARHVARGLDVHVAPVAAYSTLGYLEDPLFDSMLAGGELRAAALIFHELAHQAVWVPGDAEFNEAFASVVEAVGLRRWLAGEPERLDAALARLAREREQEARVVAVREQLQRLYAGGDPPGLMRQRKQELLAALAAGLPAGGEWNNARLAAFTTYQRCVPGLEALLGSVDGMLPRFYEAVRALRRDAPARDGICGRS